MATQITRRYIDAEVEDAIGAQFDLGRSPRQAEKALSADPRFAGRLPTLRTFQRIARERVPDASEPWSISDSNPDDGPAIIAALRDVVVYSNGERLHLSKGEADGIARIARLAPDVPPLAHFLLSKSRERDVQVFLALAPWREAAAHDYFGFVARGGLRIPIFPPMPTLVDEHGSFWERIAWIWHTYPAVAQALGKQGKQEEIE